MKPSFAGFSSEWVELLLALIKRAFRICVPSHTQQVKVSHLVGTSSFLARVGWPCGVMCVPGRGVLKPLHHRWGCGGGVGVQKKSEFASPLLLLLWSCVVHSYRVGLPGLVLGVLCVHELWLRPG